MSGRPRCSFGAGWFGSSGTATALCSVQPKRTSWFERWRMGTAMQTHFVKSRSGSKNRSRETKRSRVRRSSEQPHAWSAFTHRSGSGALEFEFAIELPGEVVEHERDKN